VAVDSAAAAEEEEEAADEDEPDSQTIFAGKYENGKMRIVGMILSRVFFSFLGRFCFWFWRLVCRAR
jgi:hypothetical protein